MLLIWTKHHSLETASTVGSRSKIYIRPSLFIQSYRRVYFTLPSLYFPTLSMLIYYNITTYLTVITNAFKWFQRGDVYSMSTVCGRPHVVTATFLCAAFNVHTEGQAQVKASGRVEE